MTEPGYREKPEAHVARKIPLLFRDFLRDLEREKLRDSEPVIRRAEAPLLASHTYSRGRLMLSPTSHSPPRARQAYLSATLDELLSAHEYAKCSGTDPITFAVEIQYLNSIGASNNDLRWLMTQGIVSHLRAELDSNSPTRNMKATDSLTIDNHSCFLLSADGIEIARRQAADTERDVCPSWDQDSRELWFGDELIKRFRAPARNQETVLTAFEEMKWPVCIDDPLPPIPSQDSKSRIQETIKSLNRRRITDAIRFRGDGTGTGVRWEVGE